MQKAYELIMEKKLDKRNFRKKALATPGLIELDEYTKSSSKRPARLYTFDNIKLNSKRAHFIKKETKQMLGIIWSIMVKIGRAHV